MHSGARVMEVRGRQLSTFSIRGADLNWVGYDKLSPLDAANRSGAAALVQWLRGPGRQVGERTNRRMTATRKLSARPLG